MDTTSRTDSATNSAVRHPPKKKQKTSTGDKNNSSSIRKGVAKRNIKPASMAASTLGKKPTMDCFQELVTVEVGNKRKIYNIHKDLLCVYSDYSRGALDGSFQEALEKKITLEAVDPGTFDIFNGWIYTRELRDSKGNVGSAMRYRYLFYLWNFGDQCMIPFLQNTAMNAIWTQANTSPMDALESITMLCDSYSYTTENSVLRKACIDIVAYNTDLEDYPAHDDFGKQQQNVTKGLFDVILVLQTDKTSLSRGKLQIPAHRRDRCYYHVHHNGERCSG